VTSAENGRFDDDDSGEDRFAVGEEEGGAMVQCQFGIAKSAREGCLPG
jgi:hypothetical protein